MTEHVVETLRKWLPCDDESGQDLLEYALLVALISLVAFGAVQTVGTTINGVFWNYISGVVGGI
jgi:Flp pilus assembly pilin Flp